MRILGRALPTSGQGQPALSRGVLIISGGFQLPKAP